MLLVLCLICGYLIQPATCDTDFNITVVDGNSVDGETLIKMGRKNSQPMLTLIGMTIRKLQHCEWTYCSACTAKRPGYFGTRTRTCSTEGQDPNKAENTEENIRVCEGNCPNGYNQTDSGYCFKLYNTTFNWDNAENVCHSEGGHLAYTGAETKFKAVKNMLQGFRGYAWIDGRRKDVYSPWKNVHGDALTKYFWYSSQPSNSCNKLCILLYYPREWTASQCSYTFYPLCEVL